MTKKPQGAAKAVHQDPAPREPRPSGLRVNGVPVNQTPAAPPVTTEAEDGGTAAS